MIYHTLGDRDGKPFADAPIVVGPVKTEAFKGYVDVTPPVYVIKVQTQVQYQLKGVI